MRQGQQGFTLLELSFSIVIISIIASAGLTIVAATLDERQFRETQGRMQAIADGILNYRRAFDRIPCPSDLRTALSSTSFGEEAADPGTCTGDTPTANFDASLDDGGPVAGGVPTKALQIPDEYAFDGYGRRILYAVDTRLTETAEDSSTFEAPFRTYRIDDTTIGNLTVKDAAGTTRTDAALYVIVSFGKNGHGAYPRQGGTSRIGKNSSNVAELENCDCDSTGGGSSFDGVFIQKPVQENKANPNDAFDDVVMFGTRSDLAGNYE